MVVIKIISQIMRNLQQFFCDFTPMTGCQQRHFAVKILLRRPKAEILTDDFVQDATCHHYHQISLLHSYWIFITIWSKVTTTFGFRLTGLHFQHKYGSGRPQMKDLCGLLQHVFIGQMPFLSGSQPTDNSIKAWKINSMINSILNYITELVLR